MDTDNAWRAPTVPDDETLLYLEPGRVLQQERHRVCYSAYWYSLSQCRRGRLLLRVKHGAGEECLDLGYSNPQKLAAFAALDSDSRYMMFHTLRSVGDESAKTAASKMRHEYAKAFVDGRLRKRKQRGANEVKVWIDAVGPVRQNWIKEGETA